MKRLLVLMAVVLALGMVGCDNFNLYDVMEGNENPTGEKVLVPVFSLSDLVALRSLSAKVLINADGTDFQINDAALTYFGTMFHGFADVDESQAGTALLVHDQELPMIQEGSTFTVQGGNDGNIEVAILPNGFTVNESLIFNCEMPEDIEDAEVIYREVNFNSGPDYIDENNFYLHDVVVKHYGYGPNTDLGTHFGIPHITWVDIFKSDQILGIFVKRGYADDWSTDGSLRGEGTDPRSLDSEDRPDLLNISGTPTIENGQFYFAGDNDGSWAGKPRYYCMLIVYDFTKGDFTYKGIDSSSGTPPFGNGAFMPENPDNPGLAENYMNGLGERLGTVLSNLGF